MIHRYCSIQNGVFVSKLDETYTIEHFTSPASEPRVIKNIRQAEPSRPWDPYILIIRIYVLFLITLVILEIAYISIKIKL